MFEFIKLQVALGNLTLEQAKAFVGKFITEAEYEILKQHKEDL